jgi:hypothetical protein
MEDLRSSNGIAIVSRKSPYYALLSLEKAILRPRYLSTMSVLQIVHNIVHPGTSDHTPWNDREQKKYLKEVLFDKKTGMFMVNVSDTGYSLDSFYKNLPYKIISDPKKHMVHKFQNLLKTVMSYVAVGTVGASALLLTAYGIMYKMHERDIQLSDEVTQKGTVTVCKVQESTDNDLQNTLYVKYHENSKFVSHGVLGRRIFVNTDGRDLYANLSYVKSENLDGFNVCFDKALLNNFKSTSLSNNIEQLENSWTEFAISVANSASDMGADVHTSLFEFDNFSVSIWQIKTEQLLRETLLKNMFLEMIDPHKHDKPPAKARLKGSGDKLQYLDDDNEYKFYVQPASR